jgi:hypothetical protein
MMMHGLTNFKISLNPADEDGRIRENVGNYTASRAKKTLDLKKSRCQNFKSGKN